MNEEYKQRLDALKARLTPEVLEVMHESLVLIDGSLYDHDVWFFLYWVYSLVGAEGSLEDMSVMWAEQKRLSTHE